MGMTSVWWGTMHRIRLMGGMIAHLFKCLCLLKHSAEAVVEGVEAVAVEVVGAEGSAPSWRRR